jgi:hypothetical protein
VRWGFSRPMAGDWGCADEMNRSRKDTGRRGDEEAMMTIR